MKFLIHSNAPTVPSGYGVQTALLADRLAADGHEVAVSCTWGHQVNLGMWRSPSGYDIPLYPGISQSGDEVIHEHAMHFFGDARGGWIILLLDVWSLQSPLLADFNVIAWAPVDHDPVPPAVVEFFGRSKALCLAMSRHGELQFERAGLAPAYTPLAVDTSVYRPKWTVNIGDRQVSSREFFHLPENAFVVGMVGMNKDPNDRKGFNEAFQAFARFRASHRHAVLFVHTERHGLYNGLNLPRMAASYGIPAEAIVFTDAYAYRMGFPPHLMAAAYTAMDVLLAPSAGEGFCVPLIEAQACGTPVIASNFTAQTELVGAGWLLAGQRWWNPATSAHYFRASVDSIVEALVEAHDSNFVDLSAAAREFAEAFDADRVYDEYWRPLVASLTPEPPADKPPLERVAVLVPVLERPENVAPLVESFLASTDDTARLYFVTDPDDDVERKAVLTAAKRADGRVQMLTSNRGPTFAAKINEGYAQTDEDWIFVCGDDCEFTPGWLDEARKLSDRFDVIGTNDSEEGRVRNQRVAAGVHADHFFVRRSYIDDEGSCLDGPGVAAPEAYFHFYTDVEIVQLAKARGVFSPCLASRVIHHHPGFDGREDVRAADATYSRAATYAEKDNITFQRRAPLIEEQSIVRGSIW